MIKVCTDSRHGEIMYKDLPSCPACKALDAMEKPFIQRLSDELQDDLRKEDEDHS